MQGFNAQNFMQIIMFQKWFNIQNSKVDNFFSSNVFLPYQMSLVSLQNWRGTNIGNEWEKGD